jgi:YD repeat-containing protein
VAAFTYNAAGDLLTLTDPKSQVTTWKYDEYGPVTNKLDHLGTNLFRYKYDANNRLTNRWSAAKGLQGGEKMSREFTKELRSEGQSRDQGGHNAG